MNRHFNTHIEGLNLQLWHDLIESRVILISLKKGEYLCRKDEPISICEYVKSGYFIYTVDGANHSKENLRDACANYLIDGFDELKEIKTPSHKDFKRSRAVLGEGFSQVEEGAMRAL